MYFLNNKNVEFHLKDHECWIICSDLATYEYPGFVTKPHGPKYAHCPCTVDDINTTFYKCQPWLEEYTLEEFTALVRNFENFVKSSEWIDVYEYTDFTDR